MELEHNKSFFILKFGTEFAFSLGNWWDLGASVTYDWNEAYGAWSFGVTAGKRFGPTVVR